MTPTYIDIILNKNVSEITEPESIAELNSDHNPIVFQIKNQTKENSTKTVTTYKNTDWNRFRQDLSNMTIINNNVNTSEDIDREVEILTKNLRETKRRHT